MGVKDMKCYTILDVETDKLLTKRTGEFYMTKGYVENKVRCWNQGREKPKYELAEFKIVPVKLTTEEE